MKKILILAPHHDYNNYNGGNIYCNWISSCLTSDYEVHLLNKSGLWIVSQVPQNIKPNKLFEIPAGLAALLTIITFSQYFKIRLTPLFFNRILKKFNLEDYSFFVVSFVHIFFSISDIFRDEKVIVLTHNYDVDIYERMIRSGGFKGLIAKISLINYVNSLKNINKSDNILLASISDFDRDKFNSLTDGVFKSTTLPVSFGEPHHVKNSSNNADKNLRLVFLGSLNTPFNIEALLYFSDVIYPILASQAKFEFFVVGSNPTEKVKKLAHMHGWTLCQNLDDKELDKLLITMTAGVLPFEYSQGVKLKIWKFFSLGLPVIGTGIFKNDCIHENFFHASNNFLEWIKWLKSLDDKSSIDAHSYWRNEVANTASTVVNNINKFYCD